MILNDYGEGEIVIRRCGWRVRLYLGHTGKRHHRWVPQWWRSDLSRGVFLVPWADRVIGVQWRRAD